MSRVPRVRTVSFSLSHDILLRGPSRSILPPHLANFSLATYFPLFRWGPCLALLLIRIRSTSELYRLPLFILFLCRELRRSVRAKAVRGFRCFRPMGVRILPI